MVPFSISSCMCTVFFSPDKEAEKEEEHADEFMHAINRAESLESAFNTESALLNSS